MSDTRWAVLADRLGLEAEGDCLCGARDGYSVGLTSRAGHTWLGLIVENREGHRWALTRRWEPQARAPRRPDARTVRFKDLRLTERYVGTADDPAWFRDALPASAAEALIMAADANRLGACTLRLRTHVLLAQYRAVPEKVPDLTETLAALRVLAQALDGASPNLPDPARVPLVARDDLDAVPARRIECTRHGITIFPVSRAGGLLGMLRPSGRVRMDWDAKRLETPDWAVATASLRQVVVWEEDTVCALACLDLAGAPALAVSAPKWRNEPGCWTRHERPYLLSARG